MSKQLTDNMFNSLVSNAIDFLKHSVDELERSPKYSVISFCSAIEIFLKARLLLEHWTLVVEDAGKANIDQFQSGESKTVGMEETISRLQNTAKVAIPQEALDSFDQLRRHRNKLVHFFHSAYVSKPDPKTIESVVIEQGKAWFYLHRLLTKNWKGEFGNHLQAIEEVNEIMRKQRGYLQAKYKTILPGIEAGKQKGNAFGKCPSCRVESTVEVKPEFGPVVTTRCLVCEIESQHLKAPCPSCKAINLFNVANTRDLVEPCSFCSNPTDWEDLTGTFIDPSDAAFCDECLVHLQSVVPIESKWLCTVCFTIHNGPEQCDWCGSLITGDIEESYVAGCLICDGMVGHYMAKDD